MTLRAIGAVWLAVAVTACGHAIFVPPAGPGRNASDASAAWTAAIAPCRGADSYQAVLRMSGRAGSQRIWPLAVETAVTTDRIYMNATHSGQPVFVLAGSASDATLWLRRNDPERVVKAPAGAIVDAILGLSVPPERLLAVLTGCVTRAFDIVSAAEYDGLLRIETADARVFLQRTGSAWRPRAGVLEGFTVEFGWETSPLPAKVWIQSTPGREPRASVTLAVSDAAVNQPIPATVFTAPAGASRADPMTLEELRSVGAWKERD